MLQVTIYSISVFKKRKEEKIKEETSFGLFFFFFFCQRTKWPMRFDWEQGRGWTIAPLFVIFSHRWPSTSEIFVRSQYSANSPLRRSLILTRIETNTISDEEKPVGRTPSLYLPLHRAPVTSQSHINENISSNIYAISAAANPSERTEPQV